MNTENLNMLKTPPVVEQVVEEHTDQREPVGQIVSDVDELLVLQEMPLQAIPDKVHDQPHTGYPVDRQEVYISKMKKTNPIVRT